MAECHPVAFRWPMKAKVEHGAKLIHVDPRFTRTSAMCDLYAPIRAGSDIAFLGGLINYVINSERWNTDSFFHEYLLNYTNAACIVRNDFKGTEELDGVFSGLMEYEENAGLALRRLRRASTRPTPGSTPARARSTASRAAARRMRPRDAKQAPAKAAARTSRSIGHPLAAQACPLAR